VKKGGEEGGTWAVYVGKALRLRVGKRFVETQSGGKPPWMRIENKKRQRIRIRTGEGDSGSFQK